MGVGSRGADRRCPGLAGGVGDGGPGQRRAAARAGKETEATRRASVAVLKVRSNRNSASLLESLGVECWPDEEEEDQNAPVANGIRSPSSRPIQPSVSEPSGAARSHKDLGEHPPMLSPTLGR